MMMIMKIQEGEKYTRILAAWLKCTQHLLQFIPGEVRALSEPEPQRTPLRLSAM